ncbi:Clavaminate synthase-like protein [Westerdykella ornata]|uniref:Clavaminate synthase-like protein n=1 Tax=Westerdykella ornata TaxID=318751 RepID=A0A6A6JQB0_WESOR|nr:Clavaminate synthase-like protein [Westerdykella ornata]KAF2278567.1 Clavaminate synthase-like protein [Westerdykella ornata]
MRHVSTNRPFVIRRGASLWPACQKWSASHLKSIMGDEPVNVAITPHGNADSVLQIPREDGEEPLSLFVKPYETMEPFSEVLDTIRTQQILNASPRPPSPVRYLQTQNDNLRNEYTKLFSDLPSSVPFARIALQKPPDAINFWLGNSYSTTALHKDNYENVYVQVLGKKHFVLLPPVEAPCVNERAILSATYRPVPEALSSTPATGDPSLSATVVPHIDEPLTYTPFCTWDPDVPHRNTTPFSSLSQPIRVTLEPGDMLYLPALWYHKVGQSCNEEGICCAVNYWYDLEFGGGFWSMAAFVRSAGLLALPEHNHNGDTKTEERKVPSQ